MRPPRMTTLLTAGLLLVLTVATSARAEEGPAERRERLTRAARLVEQGLDALRDGRHDAALEILDTARKAAPAEAVVTYDHALALAAAGKLEAARAAYAEALGAADAASPAGPAARHNLGTMLLGDAREAVRVLADPDALADAIRAQGSPDGQPMTPDTVNLLAGKLRSKLVEEGLSAARESVGLLRDAVRSDPAASDAATNLVLAQRARRQLLEEQRKLSQEPQKGGEDGNDNAPPEGENGDQGDESAPPPDGGDEKEPDDPSGGNEQESEANPEEGSQGESTPPSGEPAPETAAESRDLDREEAERALERLLDAAARKARKVEQMRAQRLRRGAVEKDW